MTDRIGAEFIGKARALRERIGAGERQFMPTRDAVWEALHRRQRRKPTFRHPECIDLFRQWKAVKAYGQLDTAIMKYTKTRVVINNIRLVTTLARYDNWDGQAREDAIGMSMIRLIADGDGLRQAIHTLVSFNLHALARYYQRAFQPNDDALIAAMWGVLPQAVPLLNGEADEFAMSWTPSGGHWFGVVVNGYDPEQTVEDGEIQYTTELDVRTFHTGDKPMY